MPRPILPALLAFGGLTACGGGGTGGGDMTETVARATTFTETYLDSSTFTDVAYDPDLDVFRITYPAGDGTFLIQSLGRNLAREAIIPDGFRVYGEGDAIIVRGVTDSGAGTVYALRDAFDGAEYSLERIGDTILPTSGSATYTGGYSGLLADLDNNLVNLGQINGLATLTADFANASIGGEITDRVNGDGRDFDDLILTTTSLDMTTGAFDNTTEGGVLVGLDYDTAEGSFNGLIVGANGNEIVGGVQVIHEDTERTTILETGGFVLQD